MYQIRMYVPHFMIPGTYYVPDTYDTRYVLCTRYLVRMYHTCRCTINSTAVSLFVYSLVGGGITRTFRPWTHTSDDSYICQLSLVVATATTDCIFQILPTFLDRVIHYSLCSRLKVGVPKRFHALPRLGVPCWRTGSECWA